MLLSENQIKMINKLAILIIWYDQMTKLQYCNVWEPIDTAHVLIVAAAHGELVIATLMSASSSSNVVFLSLWCCSMKSRISSNCERIGARHRYRHRYTCRVAVLEVDNGGLSPSLPPQLSHVAITISGYWSQKEATHQRCKLCRTWSS
jgi:hypothetical protein